MNYVNDLLSNQVLLSAFGGWLIAQVSKILIEIIKGDFSLKRLSGGGGMPSSHSATVTGLFVSAGLTAGLDSSSFAVAFFLAIIVMYDAMGVRYETGREAAILNALRRRDLAEGREPLSDHDLDEKMGHTFPEIAVGVCIGILSAILVCRVIF